MDSYAEQIIKKSDDGSDNAKRMLCLIGGIAAGILIIVISMFIHLTLIGSVLGVLAFYGGLYLGTNYDVEYEYLIVNGEFDIDKIMAKKRRKKMLTVKVGDFEDFGIYTKDMTEPEDVTLIWAVGTAPGEEYETYYADFSHSVYGKCRLLISPSVKVLREIKLYLKGQLKTRIGDLPAEEEF